MIGIPNLRHFSANSTNSTKGFQCHPNSEVEATIILSLASLGIVSNVIMISLILINKHLRRWSQGLLFHQGMVDCGRAAILLPLGFSVLRCEPIRKCSLVETAFLLLVTVSTVNMLTTVLNDSPVFPEQGGDDDEYLVSGPILLDSPQCVLFGTFMIWFASITINLGPTFLSGAMAARSEMIRNTPSCPLIHGPFRHYVLNALWITINVICVVLTLFHLHKLHRDLTKANVEAVRVAGLVTTLINVTGSSGPISRRNDDNNAATTSRSKTVDGSRAKIESKKNKSKGIRNAIEEHRKMRNYLLRMEREGIQKVKMFSVITAAYLLFWGPLFFVTIVKPLEKDGNEIYEVTLRIAYIHASINPILFLILHRGLRHAAFRLCCGFLYDWLVHLYSNRDDSARITNNSSNGDDETADFAAVEISQGNLLVPVPPPPPPIHQSPAVIAQSSSSISVAVSPQLRSAFIEPTTTGTTNYISDNANLQILNIFHRTPSKTPSTVSAEVQYYGYSSGSD